MSNSALSVILRMFESSLIIYDLVEVKYLDVNWISANSCIYNTRNTETIFSSATHEITIFRLKFDVKASVSVVVRNKNCSRFVWSEAGARSIHLYFQFDGAATSNTKN